MSFKIKSTEELEKMDATQLDAYKSELATYEKGLREKEISEAVEAVKTELQAEIKKAQDANVELENQIKELKDSQVEKSKENENVSMLQSIKSALLANKESIEKLKDNSKETVSITIKAVAPMTFATHTTGAVGRTERESGFNDTFRRTPILLELANTSTTNAKTIEWIEKTGREGGVAMVEEGGLKPQGDWNLSVHSQSAKKQAIIVTISKEMLDDIDGMALDIYQEMDEQLRLFHEEQILTGDGTGNNIVGIDANAVPFVAGSFAGTVVNPNTSDVIRVAINQIELTHDYPTAVLMHPSDATAMELEKDPTTSQYILPPFTTAGGALVKGLPVRTSVLVTQGELYVGNFKRYKAKIREAITLEMGYRGAQGDWEKNMVSFLGEARHFGFIPAVHYASIVKADIATAIGLLEV